MLKNLLKIRSNAEEGFTLTELIVVIVIIGILAAIAVPMYLNNRKQAIDAQTESNVKNMAVVADRYFHEDPNDPDFKSKVINEMKINEGTTPIIYQNSQSDPDGFCILGFNDAGGKYTTGKNAFKYDSSAGGVGEWSSNCDIGQEGEFCQLGDYAAMNLNLDISNSANFKYYEGQLRMNKEERSIFFAVMVKSAKLDTGWSSDPNFLIEKQRSVLKGLDDGSVLGNFEEDNTGNPQRGAGYLYEDSNQPDSSVYDYELYKKIVEHGGFVVETSVTFSNGEEDSTNISWKLPDDFVQGSNTCNLGG